MFRSEVMNTKMGLRRRWGVNIVEGGFLIWKVELGDRCDVTRVELTLLPFRAFCKYKDPGSSSLLSILLTRQFFDLRNSLHGPWFMGLRFT